MTVKAKLPDLIRAVGRDWTTLSQIAVRLKIDPERATRRFRNHRKNTQVDCLDPEVIWKGRVRVAADMIRHYEIITRHPDDDKLPIAEQRYRVEGSFCPSCGSIVQCLYGGRICQECEKSAVTL